MSINYYSIGSYCQTAYQINRYNDRKESGFFNWLSSPLESLNFITDSDNTEFLLENNLEFIPNNTYETWWLRDKFSGLFFPHEYELSLQDQIDEKKVANQIPISRKKFLYLKEKFLDRVSKDENPVLIRVEDQLTSFEAYDRLKYLENIFLKINPRIKFILASVSFEKKLIKMPNAMFFRLEKHKLWSNPKISWMGDDDSWNDLFKTSEKILMNADIKKVKRLFKKIN